MLAGRRQLAGRQLPLPAGLLPQPSCQRMLSLPGRADLSPERRQSRRSSGTDACVVAVGTRVYQVYLGYPGTPGTLGTPVHHGTRTGIMTVATCGPAGGRPSMWLGNRSVLVVRGP